MHHLRLLKETNKLTKEIDSSSDYCTITGVSDVYYEGTPGVTRFLHFDVECDQKWLVDPGGCIPGDTFIGENFDIHWEDVTFCAESDDLKVLHCVSDSSVGQKVSWTIVRMLKEDCAWNSPKFFTPPLLKEGGKPDKDADLETRSECTPPECYPED